MSLQKTPTIREMLLGNFYPGLEDFQSGKPVQEIEYTIYAELPDLSGLNGAYKKEEQEQWKIPFAVENNVRARIRCVNGREWQYTTKSTSDDYTGSKEITTVVSKEFFEEHKLIATDGYKKTRYFFRTETEGLEWEVDVFMTKNGGKPSLWVKIDLEVKDLEQKVPKLPFKVLSLVVADREGLTLTERARIKSLWDSEWARLDDTVAEEAALDTPNSNQPSSGPERQ